MVIIVYVDILHLVCFMQELHVLIEVDRTLTLNRVLHIQVVAFLKQNRREVNWHAIMDRVDAHIVLNHTGLYAVLHVVVDRIAHVLRHRRAEALVVHLELAILEHFDEHVQLPRVFVRVETYLEHFLGLVLLLASAHDVRMV